MKLLEHPRSDEFLKWFAKHVTDAKPLSGVYYRVAGPRHTTATEIISGVGAFKDGGRWNPPDVMPVVYLSELPETAVREATENFRYHLIPIWKGMPRVVVAVQATLLAVFDLTKGPVADGLPESMTLLLAEDWRAMMSRGKESTTQAFGRAAYFAGIQALLVPSKPDPKDTNLLVFPNNLAKDAKLSVLNAHELDKIGRAS